MFTPVPRRLRLHVTPYLYAQRWNILPLLGPLILHRIVIYCNKSSDVLLSLHVQVREISQHDSYVERLEVGDIGDQV